MLEVLADVGVQVDRSVDVDQLAVTAQGGEELAKVVVGHFSLLVVGRPHGDR
jgi:hypothetical protein